MSIVFYNGMDMDEKQREKTKKIIAELVSYYGSQAKFGKAITTHKHSISSWFLGKGLPGPEACIKIEKATNGKYTRHDLRPDIEW